MTKMHRLGKIKLTHQGTFAISEHPTEKGVMPNNYLIDRWGPVEDSDKDRIAHFSQVREEWVSAARGIWFGFEGEGMVFPQHLFEYYNLIIIRPKIVDKFTAVDIVATRLDVR